MEPRPNDESPRDDTPMSSLWLRVAQYLLGGLPPDEQAAMERWIAADPERARELRELQSPPLAIPASIDDVARTEQALAAVAHRANVDLRGALSATLSVPTPAPQPQHAHPLLPKFPGFPQRSRVSVLWYALAALVIGAVGITIGWTGATRRLIGHTSRLASTYATTNGQRATITLLDGTVVSLNVASQLDVPADFADGNHTVTLIGEALFTVSHHDGTPFSVIAGSAKTQVLGTSFIVRHYPNDTTTLVAVHDGKVKIGSTVVTPQQFVEVTENGAIQLRRADPAAFSFATGLLLLTDMPLSTAIPELNRWYDADIRLGDPILARQRIGGRFATGSLSDLTHVLEMAFDVRVVRNGRVLTLYPRS